ncbi:MAG: DUF4465 domain-containing protein [Bacteroidaceae bacterium]|nr:DUF4465 domain-containing protein [Bacteroidaceae bacterium]
MKKFYSFALLALTMGFVFVSCDDEKDDPQEDKTAKVINTLPVESIQGVTVEGVTSYTLSLSLKDNQYYLATDTTNKVGYYFKDNIEIAPFVINHTFGEWGFGEAFTFSSCSDATTPGYTNLSAITKKGVSTNAYLISNSGLWNSTPSEISFVDGKSFLAKEIYVTNATYAYLAIKDQNDGNESPLVKKWTADDEFILTITGYSGGEITDEVDVYLAEGMDILNTWKKVDLSSLGYVTSIGFSVSSTDTGDWGMNTPAYFCIDKLTVEEHRLK